ncbi:MAG TPA: protein kinase [Patescibacteria group bacterium]
MAVEAARSMQMPHIPEVTAPKNHFAIGDPVGITSEDGTRIQFRVEQIFQNGEAYKLIAADGTPIMLKPFVFSGNAKDLAADQLAFVNHQLILQRANEAGVPRIPQGHGFLHIEQGPQAGWYSIEGVVPGVDLDTFIQTHNVSVKQRLQIFAQVAETVAALHQVPTQPFDDQDPYIGIVHRDLNPKNILVAENGTAFVIDFGASGINGLPTGHERVMFAVDGYRALEQMNPQNPAETANDVYTLGIILYHLFGGHPTDDELFQAGIDNKQSSLEGTPIFENLRQTNPDIANMIFYATQLGPSHRPTAAQIAQAAINAIAIR